MHLSRYLKIYPSTEKPGYFLLFSTRLASKVVVPGSILKAAQDGTLTPSEEETLKRLGMLVCDPDEEREQMRSVLDRAFEKSNSVKATVVLNLDCNLDCTYCYEGGFRGDLYMTEATADLLVQTMIRDYISKGMDTALSFYGGEPLLSGGLIRKISAALREAADLHKVDYRFSLLTNGTLLNRRTAEELIPYGLKSAKFTLDGPREIHDRQRPYASGSGSFDTIVDNIAAVSDIIDVILGGNFYRENYRDFPLLLDHLLSCGITPDRISRVQFTPIMPQAGCTEHSAGCFSSSEVWLTEALPFLREATLSRGFAAAKTTASACMVEFPNIIVVNFDGSLYKCPAFMGNTSLCIGTLADGINDYTQSHCIGNWKIDRCLDCSYLPLCFGGCRFLTQLQGRPLTELDCRCHFFDATLESMILQDIVHRVGAPKGPSATPP